MTAKNRARLRYVSEAVKEVIAPVEGRCVNCGKDEFDGLGFCSDCLKDVHFNNGKTCKRCGVGIDGDEDFCGNCAFEKVYFDKSYAVFDYDGAVQHAIWQMKFRGKGRSAKIFAKYLVYYAVKHNLVFDAVCYPPMSKKSLRRRFYNHSGLLARYFCDIMDCSELYCDALVKVKETERQEQLNKQDRKENLIGAYKINADIKGKRVLVIDDVKTTGATLNECAKVLKRAGAVEVIGLTVSAKREYVPFEREEISK